MDSFDYPKYETHSESLRRISRIRTQIDPGDIANAFLFSLSTRKLEYRSALGSYYYAKAVPEHERMKSHNEILAASADHCYLCGWSAWKKEPTAFDRQSGLNDFNDQRHKYGGCLGYSNINYALFDLEQFMKLPKVVPSKEDKRIFREILSCVHRLNGPDKAGKLRDTIIKAKFLGPIRMKSPFC